MNSLINLAENNALDQRRKQSESDLVFQSINSESEDLDFNSKIFTSFNKSQRRDLVRNRINMQTEQPRHEKTELEIQMQSLEEKMADLLRSSQNSLGDYKMQQVLLSKVENIKKDFEKCSKLISRHKTTDLQEAQIEDKKPAKVEQKHRVVQKGRKNIKKDYLN